MDVFNRQGDALIWARDDETLRIEPWGRDSLRVRATVAAAIRDDLPGALLEPAPSQPIIEIGETQAVIRNGGIEARLSADGKLAFFASDSGEELLSEAPGHFVWPPSRSSPPLPAISSTSKRVLRLTTASGSTAWASISTACWIRRDA